jgi:hypothetical protein
LDPEIAPQKTDYTNRKYGALDQLKKIWDEIIQISHKNPILGIK